MSAASPVVQSAPPNGYTPRVPPMMPLTEPPLAPLPAIELLERLPPCDDHKLLPSRIAASEIELLPIFNSRTQHDEDAIEGMTVTLANGDRLLPILVYRAGGRTFLVDGHMRLEAHRRWATTMGRAGAFKVPVEWHQGSPVDAVLCSVERNTKHGVRLTAGERSDAAWRLVLIDRGLTRNQITKATGTSRRTINTMRSTWRELGERAHAYQHWADAKQAITRQRDLSVDQMLDLREARAERVADQLARALGAGLSADPDLMARAMWHYMGRKRGAFAVAVREQFGEALVDELDDCPPEF